MTHTPVPSSAYTLTLPSGCACCAADAVAGLAVMRNRVLLQCRACGGCWFAPSPTPEELAAHYRGAYADYQQPGLLDQLRVQSEAGNFAAQVSWMLGQYHLPGSVAASLPTRLWRRVRRHMNRCTTSPLRVLDYGCGPAFFLKACRDQGVEVAGCEYDADTAAYNRDVLGIPMIAVETLSSEPAESFDIIRSNHVIEHLPNPAAMLREFHRLLKPGGMMLHTMPGFSPVLVGRDAMRLEDVVYPDHLYYHTVASARTLVERAGFHVATTFTQYAAPAQVLRSCGVSAAVEGVDGLQQLLETAPFHAGSNLSIIARKTAGQPPASGGRSLAITVTPLGEPRATSEVHCLRGQRGLFATLSPAPCRLSWPYVPDKGSTLCWTGRLAVLGSGGVYLDIRDARGKSIRPTLPCSANREYAIDFTLDPAEHAGESVCISLSGRNTEIFLRDGLVTERHPGS